MKDIGRYVTFCGQHGESLPYLHPIDALGVNGLHAVVIAPVLVRVEILRMGQTWDLLITSHEPDRTENGRQLGLVNTVLFLRWTGFLTAGGGDLDPAVFSVVAPTFAYLFLTLATYAAVVFRLALEEYLMTTDQETKAEVLKLSDGLRAAAVAKVTVNYCGNGDEGRAESAQFQDSDGNPLDERQLGTGLDLRKLSDLLESFAPEGYEDGEGGFGTVTFDLETLIIRVEHNWYETVGHPDAPREI